MTQDPQKRSLNEHPQVYDSSFKDWISQQAPAILPVLLPGAIYEQTLDVEIIRPTMRVDKVFKILYDGEEQILHLEFETGYDDQLKSRLLVYNASFYRDHRLPVISMVVYPFRVKMAIPPLRIRKILTFDFQTLPLFELDAGEIVRQHHACMYPLLPTMKHVHADLIAQAMRELAELYQDDEVSLSQQLIWMELLLERTDTVTPLEKKQIEERLTMFDQLWEESPRVQKLREQIREQIHEQGLEQGKVLALHDLLINVIRSKYPDLDDFAQQQADHFDKPDVLDQLILQVMSASNVDTARRLLEAGPDM